MIVFCEVTVTLALDHLALILHPCDQIGCFFLFEEEPPPPPPHVGIKP